MARQDHNRATAYKIINLYLVLTLAYSIVIIALFLRIKAAVCSTTSLGIYSSIALSLPTIAVAGARCYLIIRQRSKNLQTVSPSTGSPGLESACTRSVPFLVVFWISLACLNLLVAIRAPVCLDQPLPEWQNNLHDQNWRYGSSCRLHRGLVALSVLMVLSIIRLSFFDSSNRHPNQRRTSLVSCYFTCRKSPKNHAFAPSISSSRSWSTLEKEEPLYLIPERRSSRFEHEQWRRRNSLSSQKAIYPHRYQWYDQRPGYTSHSLPPSRYTSTLRSVSEARYLESGNRNSSMTSSRSSKTWATAPSTRPSTISSSRTRSSSNPGKGDLRREKASVSTAGNTGIPDVPPLPTLPPPAWAPRLNHAPLSADPTLRALSTGAAARPSLPHAQSSPDLLVQPLNIKKREASEPTTAASGSTPPPRKRIEMRAPKSTSPRKQIAPPMPSVPPTPLPPFSLPTLLPTAAHTAPAIPARAPGHSTRHTSSRPPMSTNTSSGTTTRPTLSAKPSSHSSLRRPDPIRHRQQHHLHHHPRNAYSGLGISSHSQLQLPLQQYQHQRVWKHEHGYGQGQASKNLSVYSANSYGTHATDSRASCVIRESHAYTNASTPGGRSGTSGRP